MEHLGKVRDCGSGGGKVEGIERKEMDGERGGGDGKGTW